MSHSHQPTVPLAQTDPAAPWAGGRLGRYEQVRELARGGMGVVLQGYDPDADREVAIKVVAVGLEDRASVRDRFTAEARMTARLEHPGIVPVYEVGRLAGGELYFAMKLVRGAPLTARLAEHSAAYGPAQRRSLLVLLEVLRKVCDALAYAHDQGAVHRDLKPDNILLGPFGEVYVCDWGLVRAAPSKAPEPSPVRGQPSSVTHTPANLTLDGDIMGTPGYMAPEQARGDVGEIGAATDVYALGAILYHLLTGVPPHSGGTISSMIEDAAHGELVPPSLRAPGRAIPRELEAACLRAMAKDPARRYADAAGLRADLEAFLAGRELVAVRYSGAERAARWARRHPLALAVVCCLVLGWGALALQRRRDRDLAVGRLVDEARSLAARAEGQGTQGPAARQRALEDLVAASSALDHARRLDPDLPALAHDRRAAGLALGQLALESGELGLARHAFRELAHHGAEPSEVARLELEVEHVVDRQLENAREILADVKAGLERPGRPTDAPRLDDYLYTLAGTRDPRVAVELEGALTLALTGDAPPELGLLAARALARLGLSGVPGAVTAIANAIAAMPIVRPTPLASPSAHALVVEVGLALCATRSPEAFTPLARLLDRVGPNSPAWRQIAPFTRRVPPPAEDFVPRLEATQGRVLLYLAQGRDVEAMGSLDAYLAADLTDAQRAAFLVNRALVWQERHDLARAHQDLDRAIALFDLAPTSAFSIAALPLALGNRAAVRLLLRGPETALRDLERALAIRPSAELYVNLSSVRTQLGQLEEALAAMGRAIALEPARPELHTNLARMLLGSERFAEARTAIDQAIALAPRASPALVLRAVIREGLGSVDDALRDLDNAVDVAFDADELTAALVARARLHLNAGRLDAAAEDVVRARALTPEDATVRERSVALNLRLGRLDAARADLARLLERGEPSGQVLLLAAYAAELEGDATQARALVDRAIAVAPRTIEAYELRARLALALGDAAAAMRDLDQAIELAPTSVRLVERSRLHQRAGRPLAARVDADLALAAARDTQERSRILEYRIQLDLQLGDTAGASVDLRRARELTPNAPGLLVSEAWIALARGEVAAAAACLAASQARDLSPELRFMRAQAYLSAGDRAAATADLEALVDTSDARVRPLVRPLLARVVLQGGTGDAARARRELDLHLAAFPGDANTRVDLAQLLQATGNLNGAAAELETILARDPAHPLALSARAGIYRQQGNLARALADHEASLVRGDQIWLVVANHGHTLLAMGRSAEARAAFERALALAPTASRPMVEQWMAKLPK